MIKSSFAKAYFGHLPVEMAAWTELETFVDGYIGAMRCSRSRKPRGEQEEEEEEKEIALLQETFSDVMRNHRLARSYPVSPAQAAGAFRWLRHVFERNGVPTGEGLLAFTEEEARVSTASRQQEPEFIFKSFDRSAGAGTTAGTTFVTLLEENRHLLGRGTTGLTSWQGALFLSDWAQNQGRRFLEGKRVVELGCGTGLVGISILKTTDVKSYTFTDCHFRVINAVINNLQINFPPAKEDEPSEKLFEARLRQLQSGPEQKISHEKMSCTSYHHRLSREGGTDPEVVVRHLDWTSFEEGDHEGADVILGADIVYERGLLPPLCSVLRSLLRRRLHRDDQAATTTTAAAAFVACTERSHTTLAVFEDCLREARLAFEIGCKGCYSPAESVLNSDVQHQPTRIYKIVLGQVEDAAAEGTERGLL